MTHEIFFILFLLLISNLIYCVGFDFIQNNRFGSFAPIRENCRASFFVDGQDFMDKVADVLLEAKEEIYIADWWLSPEIFLKRGKDFHEDYRLDRILKKKAVSRYKLQK